MPTVPTVETFGVSPAPLPNARQSSVASPSLFDAAYVENEKLGQGAFNIATRYEEVQQRQADIVRTDDALNQVRSTGLSLKLDPQTGYASLQGEKALAKDENGLPLPDSYANKLQAKIDEVAGTLTTPYQRQQFALQANDILRSFKGEAQAHFLNEYHASAINTEASAADLASQTALSSWYDDTPGGTLSRNIEAAVTHAQRLASLKPGYAAGTVTEAGDKMRSAIHLGVIDAALASGDVGYAMQYFDDHRKEMRNGDDVLKAQKALEGQAEATAALGATASAAQVHAHQFAPNDLDRLIGATQQVKPAEGSSTADVVGLHHAAKQDMNTYLQKYGDVTKAIAAFASDDKAVDEAVKKAEAAKTPEAWTTFLPKKTQDYVTTTLKNYDAGVGSPLPPTKDEFVQTALAQLTDAEAANPKTVQLTRQQAGQQYDLTASSIKEHGEQLLTQARQALAANGYDYTTLDPGIKTQIARTIPDKLPSLIQYTKEMNDPNPATDWIRYAQLHDAALANPQAFAKYDLTQDFPKLADAERKTLLTMQGKLRDPNQIKDVATLEQQLATRHGQMKWGNNDSDRQKASAFDIVARNAIDAEEQVRGAKLNYADREKLLDRLLIDGSYKQPGDWFGSSGRYYEVQGTEGVANFVPKVPDAERAKITAALVRQGRPVTEEAITALYKKKMGL